MQNELDQLRRQHLILELAASALYNQVHGGPTPRAKEAQKELLLNAATETQHMREEIENLTRKLGFKR